MYVYIYLIRREGLELRWEVRREGFLTYVFYYTRCKFLRREEHKFASGGISTCSVVVFFTSGGTFLHRVALFYIVWHFFTSGGTFLHRVCFFTSGFSQCRRQHWRTTLTNNNDRHHWRTTTINNNDQRQRSTTTIDDNNDNQTDDIDDLWRSLTIDDDHWWHWLTIKTTTTIIGNNNDN
jgi:hypothetical protein